MRVTPQELYTALGIALCEMGSSPTYRSGSTTRPRPDNPGTRPLAPACPHRPATPLILLYDLLGSMNMTYRQFPMVPAHFFSCATRLYHKLDIAALSPQTRQGSPPGGRTALLRGCMEKREPKPEGVAVRSASVQKQREGAAEINHGVHHPCALSSSLPADLASEGLAVAVSMAPEFRMIACLPLLSMPRITAV